MELAGAYAYAGIASSGPWVVSIGGVLAIGLLATGSVEPPIRVTQFLVSITWLMSVSLLLTGPLASHPRGRLAEKATEDKTGPRL